jgi:ABC-type nitrate/sulfonate/bicarbonate transport system substrate-binding protein
MFRLLVADLDSPSYFVATAAAELGYFEAEGIDVELERAFGAEEGPKRLRDGTLHFFGGPAYAAACAFPDCEGAKILCALSQYSYWFMAVRADLDVKRGDLEALKGLRISCSPSLPTLGLRYLLAQSGIDLERDNVRIVHAPSTNGGPWKGHDGVNTLEQGIADAYWGNGMRLAIGERLGVAKLHLDLRRGDGPPGARWYNFAALTTTEQFVHQHPHVSGGVIRAIVNTQKALRLNPSLATQVGNRLFPQDEALLIADLIARDAPFYDASIAPEAIEGLNRFGTAIGIISKPVSYDRLVASHFHRNA